MSAILGLEEIPHDFPQCAVSIGVFDGVHLGHQALLSVLQSEAKRVSGPSVVLTFDRHPLELLSPDKSPFYITTLDQKLKLIEEAGANTIVLARFEHELSDLSPEDFVDEVLISKLKASTVVVGANFKFGHNRIGDVHRLQELGAERGIRVVSVEPVIIHGSKVSSTRVRHSIERGDIELAGRLLGRPFTMLGKVITGLGLGRKLGFPTANIEVSPRQAVPANGVYAVKVEIDGKPWPGVINIGVRPTLDMTTRSIEVHLIEFDGDLVGREVGIEFHCRIRDEVRFASIEELVEQIGKDVEAAREILISEPRNG